MRVLTIGGATEDLILDYANKEMLTLNSERGARSYLLFQEGQKIEIEQLGLYTGGGATNAAVSFQRLGFDVAAFFKVGIDSAGDKVIATLKAAHIDVSHVKRDPENSTAISCIIHSLSGDRTVFAFRGANASLLEEDLPWDVIGSVDQLYVTSLSDSSAMQLPAIVNYAKAHGVTVAVNPGISQLKVGGAFLKEALSSIDILILNSEEARQFMQSLIKTEDIRPANSGKTESTALPALLQTFVTHEDMAFNLRQFFKAVLAFGPEIVVVTDGAQGVYVAHEKDIYYHPSLPVKAVNTLGAGDAFGSCLVACLKQDKLLEEALLCGLLNSASVVGMQDAKSGLLTEEQLLMQFNAMSKEHLVQYPL